eukprot:TRINITY_DN44314_c0_g1_i1.p1 TRINITY_DN44314_c0_g1~~TRINITY_DN44314_c0_g1_i1.p1  ORF type:complete len:270 (+),score=37.59 TRINITY_DN44314_c0_g1_i1:41-850(+)
MKKNYNHDALRDLLSKSSQDLKENNPISSKNDDFDEKRFIESCLNFPPAPHMQYLFRVEAEEDLKAGKHEEAANKFIIMQALQFKHQFQIQQVKRNSKRVFEAHRGKGEKKERSMEMFEETEVQRKGMLFNNTTKVCDLMKDLPEGWTVLQISLYQSLKMSRYKNTKKNLSIEEGNPNLVLIRLSNDGNKPTARVVKSKASEKVVPYLKELEHIIKEESLVLKEAGTDRKKYWALREDLNKRMKTLVKSMETSWLGHNRCLLLGQFEDG